jgi:hypothetical protein
MKKIRVNKNVFAFLRTRDSFGAMKCPKCNGTGKVLNSARIGADMKRHRKKAGIGLREMARSMSISHGYLCQLEKGKRAWRLPLINHYTYIIENYGR